MNLSFNPHILPCPTELNTRFYHALAAGTEAIHTIAKIAHACFTTLVAAINLGSSNYLNQNVICCWNDVKFSMDMVALSIKGVVKPKEVIEKKQQANINYWDQKDVTLGENTQLSDIENVSLNILCCSDFVVAGLGATLAMSRVIFASLLYPLSGGSSQLLPKIFVLQTASVTFHLFEMGIAAAGAINKDARDLIP